MADISMCRNCRCLLKGTCFRFLATPSEYQAYLLIDKDVETEADCDSYWKCDTNKQRKELDKVWQDFYW